MNKKIIASLLALLMIVLMPCGALALSSPTISSDSKTGQTIFEGEGEIGDVVSIVVEKNQKRYYVDSDYIGKDGKYEFRSILPSNTEFEGRLNLGGEAIAFPFKTSQEPADGGDDGPIIPDETFEITLSIDKKTIDRGYVLRPTKVKASKGENVWDVTKREMDERGIEYDIKFYSEFNSVYVESIEGEGEFDHGPKSGWMYNVNGYYPDVGASRYKLSSGDRVQWRYTTNLGKDLGRDMSQWENSESTGVLIKDKYIEINTEVKVSGGVATASITSDQINKAIEELKKNEKNELVLAPIINKDVEKVVVNLPKSAIKELKDHKDVLMTVKSNIVKISISDKALKTISNENGSNVSITAQRADIEKLSDEHKKLVKDKPIFNLKIHVDGKEVRNFDGKVYVSFPYTPAENEDTKNLTVYHIDDDGNATEMKGAYYDSKTKSVVFETDHFSTFAIVYNENTVEEIIPEEIVFEDVKDTDWFYPSVQYVLKNGLFRGISETKFGPNDKMTRAMLVTVLYNMEENPSVTARSAFSDIQMDEWYFDPVLWALEEKIVSGYTNGFFGPNDSTTREQIITILYNYAQSKGSGMEVLNDLSGYTDRDQISNWAMNPMKWAVTKKIISGRSETNLEPKGTATRAEVATILMKFMESNKE